MGGPCGPAGTRPVASRVRQNIWKNFIYTHWSSIPLDKTRSNVLPYRTCTALQAIRMDRYPGSIREWIGLSSLEGLAMGLSKTLVVHIQFHLEEKWSSC